MRNRVRVRKGGRVRNSVRVSVRVRKGVGSEGMDYALRDPQRA